MTSKFETVSQFVRQVTKPFDASHDYNHALDVYNLSMLILKNNRKLENNYYIPTHDDEELVMISALCHDVCDTKYLDRGSITKDELKTFIQSVYPEEVENIMLIIENISYSKENKGLLQILPQPYQYYRDVVSDADKLLAIGKTGIERCYEYNKSLLSFLNIHEIISNDKINADVLQHCHDKLKRLYPENFIRTPAGRDMAAPLHQEILDYIKLNTK